MLGALEMIQNVKTAAEGNQALQDEMRSRGWIELMDLQAGELRGSCLPSNLCERTTRHGRAPSQNTPTKHGGLLSLDVAIPRRLRGLFVSQTSSESGRCPEEHARLRQQWQAAQGATPPAQAAGGS